MNTSSSVSFLIEWVKKYTKTHNTDLLPKRSCVYLMNRNVNIKIGRIFVFVTSLVPIL